MIYQETWIRGDDVHHLARQQREVAPTATEVLLNASLLYYVVAGQLFDKILLNYHLLYLIIIIGENSQKASQVDDSVSHKERRRWNARRGPSASTTIEKFLLTIAFIRRNERAREGEDTYIYMSKRERSAPRRERDELYKRWRRCDQSVRLGASESIREEYLAADPKPDSRPCSEPIPGTFLLLSVQNSLLDGFVAAGALPS